MARPRSAQAHNKVLTAAVELFSARGIDATSMDAIAESSGVSKATIYKHWPDKDALCLEVMSYLHGLDEEPPVFDSGDFRADLIAQLQYQPATDRKALREKMVPHMIAYASRNQVLGVAWRARVIEPARVALTNIIRRGERRGVLRHGIDPEVGIALLLGPMMYRHIFVQKAGQKVPKDLEIQVADAFLAAFGAAKPRLARR
ncbi:MAG TPA: TetR/AcrR family transcriptional regulator [Acidobacteriaceae bacterium]|jgi:AcrR family transcriptional regulator